MKTTRRSRRTQDTAAYYAHPLSEHIARTAEGYLICREVPVARTGIQRYLAGELGLPGDPERTVEVERREEDVFAPEAMASFEGKPVTDGHPAQAVAAENCAAYAKGHVQNVRRRGGYLLADLYITDPCLRSQIENRVKREISCGYRCVYEEAEGGCYRQRNIRGNHVAVVPEGRAGRAVSIQDEKGRTSMSEFMKSVSLLPEKLDRLLAALEALLAALAPAADGEAPAGGGAPEVEQALEVLADPEVAQALETVAAVLPEEGGEAVPVYPETLLPESLPAQPAEDPARQAADALRRIHQAAVYRSRYARDARPGTFSGVCQAQQRAYAARNPHKSIQN